MAVLGLSMTELPNGIDKIKTYAPHKSIGISVLALVLLRLVWRLFSGPAPVAPGPRWQQRAAAITHAGLYARRLAIPDRKSVVAGQREFVRVDTGGRGTIIKEQRKTD